MLIQLVTAAFAEAFTVLLSDAEPGSQAALVAYFTCAMFISPLARLPAVAALGVTSADCADAFQTFQRQNVSYGYYIGFVALIAAQPPMLFAILGADRSHRQRWKRSAHKICPKWIPEPQTIGSSTYGSLNRYASGSRAGEGGRRGSRSRAVRRKSSRRRRRKFWRRSAVSPPKRGRKAAVSAKSGTKRRKGMVSALFVGVARLRFLATAARSTDRKRKEIESIADHVSIRYKMAFE
jgi:hypothetical protein